MAGLGRLPEAVSGRHGRRDWRLESAQSMRASAAIASAAVIVHAKNDNARVFYERYGFISFPDQPMRLFLPMKTIQVLFASGQ